MVHGERWRENSRFDEMMNRTVGVLAFLTLISAVITAVAVANQAGPAPVGIELVTATTVPALSTTINSTSTPAASRATTSVAPPARAAKKVTSAAPTTTNAPAAPPPAAVTTTVAPKAVVFYLHAMYEDPQKPHRPDILAAVAEHATLVIPHACGLSNWGDACVIEDLHRLKLLHSPDRPVKVLAMSMGNAVLGNWKARYPDDVHVAVGLIPATTTLVEGLLNLVPAILDPPRPWGMSRYVCWYGQEDIVTGPPVAGTCTEVHAVAGGHTAWAPFPIPAILDVLIPGAR